MQQKFLTLGLALVSSLFIAGCSHTSTNTTAPTNTNTGSVPAAADKQGDTSKTGTISESAGRFYLNVAGQVPEEIESYAVELSNYVGQSVTVTGQYSGDTLFVGKVE